MKKYLEEFKGISSLDIDFDYVNKNNEKLFAATVWRDTKKEFFVYKNGKWEYEGEKELGLSDIREMEPGRRKMHAYDAYKNKGKKETFTSKIRNPYVHK